MFFFGLINMQEKNIQKNNGFVSLFAVLIATVILAIAIGMSSVALKQIVLASTADEANESFYSADAALQCAIALDSDNAFSGGSTIVNCVGEQIPVDDSNNEIFKFGTNGEGFEWANGNCVKVEVNKSGEVTQIEALGYNVACDQISESPRAVERALRVRYAG